MKNLIINRYGEMRSGWMMALIIILFFAVSLVGQIIASLFMSLSGLNSGELPDILTDVIKNILILFSVLLAFRLIYKRPLKQIGLYKQKCGIHTLFGGLFGAATISVATVILLVTGTERIDRINWAAVTDGIFWAELLGAVLTGIWEEIAFRGVTMTALKTTRNRWMIVLMPSSFFGIVHIISGNFTFFAFANIMLVGILLAYLFIKTGRIWMSIGFHILWNFFQGNVWGISVSGHSVSEHTMTYAVFTGPEWLTGGNFGLEGGAACTLVLLMGLAFTHFILKQEDKFWTMDSDLPLTGNRIIN